MLFSRLRQALHRGNPHRRQGGRHPRGCPIGRVQQGLLPELRPTAVQFDVRKVTVAVHATSNLIKTCVMRSHHFCRLANFPQSSFWGLLFSHTYIYMSIYVVLMLCLNDSHVFSVSLCLQSRPFKLLLLYSRSRAKTKRKKTR